MHIVTAESCGYYLPAVQVALVQVCIHTFGQGNAALLGASSHICNLCDYSR